MIRRSLLLSQDNQGSLIERAYQNSLLGKSSADFKRLDCKTRAS